MAKTVKALVLVDVTIEDQRYQCAQHVLELDPVLATQHAASLDTNPGAVKHALDSGAKLVQHKSIAVAALEAKRAHLEEELAKAPDADKPALEARLAEIAEALS